MGSVEGSSEDIVARTRAAFDAFNGRDWEAFEGFLHPEAEAEPLISELEGTFRGREGMREWWETVFSILPDFTVEAGDIHRDGSSVVVTARNAAQGASSGSPASQRIWIVVEWLDGLVRWWGTFRNEEAAREAAAGRAS